MARAYSRESLLSLSFSTRIGRGTMSFRRRVGVVRSFPKVTGRQLQGLSMRGRAMLTFGVWVRRWTLLCWGLVRVFTQPWPLDLILLDSNLLLSLVQALLVQFPCLFFGRILTTGPRDVEFPFECPRDGQRRRESERRKRRRARSRVFGEGGRRNDRPREAAEVAR